MKNILFLFLIIFSSVFGRSNEVTKILFPDPGISKENTDEIQAGADFVKQLNNYKSEIISLENLINAKDIDIKNNIIWLHRSDSSMISSIEKQTEFVEMLKNYVNEGGKLLLTLEAMRYLHLMGLEKNDVDVTYFEAIDGGYGRKLGMHSFINHPVFSGLNGGAYIWNPLEDQKCRLVGYFDDNIPSGKVIAVNWAYIRLHEETRIMIEHDYGKGKVIAIGGYTYLNQGNNNRKHLEKFLGNTIEYLNGKLTDENKMYWEYDELKVTEFSQTSESLNEIKSNAWDLKENTLSLKDQFASNNFWDVAGERILTMGFEKSGIDEIWIHPFMAFRDYELGIKFSYRDTVYWFKDQTPKIEVRPEGFIRTYQFPRAFVTEIITNDIKDPTAVLHYEYRGVYPAELYLKIKSNLRFMWPYSENVFREIKYTFDESLNAFIVKDRHDKLSAIFGSGRKPSIKLFGRYDDFTENDSTFFGVYTDKFQAAGLLSYKLNMNDNFDLILSGSNESYNKTLEYYQKAYENPEKVYKNAIAHYENLLKEHLIIETPDPVFNEGYKWALVGTDRFFVNTPGIGASLVAGYSTTRTGWNGGHQVNGRPGYGWYFGRDGQFSGLALNGYGAFERVKEVLKVYQKYQDLTGKIYHELTTSGAIHYDASDATPLYVILAAHYLKHSGDIEFIKESWPHIKRAMDYCFSTDTDGDHLIENTNVGHGWVEGGQLYKAHTELYLAGAWSKALYDASLMANLIGEKELADSYLKEAELVRNIINIDFWNEDTQFYNFSKLIDGTFNTEKTVTPAVTMYLELVDELKGQKVIDLLSTNAFTSDWGVRIVSELSPIFRPTGYHYGSVWPLFTGWTSLAHYKYGNHLQGYSAIMNNLVVYKSWALGFIEEVLNGHEYKNGGVCPHQCWSQTMVLQPIYEGMLGFQPNALNNTVSLSPVFPFDWNKVSVKNIRFKNNKIHFSMLRTGNKITYEFLNSNQEEFSMKFNPSLPLGSEIEKVLLDDKEIKFTTETNRQSVNVETEFKLDTKRKLEIFLKEGISVLPVISEPRVNDISDNFRILKTKFISNNYNIVVEGKPLADHLLEVYSPNMKIDSIKGGTIISEKNSITRIKVQLPASADKFVEQSINLKLK